MKTECLYKSSEFWKGFVNMKNYGYFSQFSKSENFEKIICNLIDLILKK